MSNQTPMMKQYFDIKEKYSDCILFFRLGDFYEMFFEDAEVASRELEITLTSRGGKEKKTPMCGVPYHASAGYIAKLIEKGFKVAICEQVEDPAKAIGIVKREVVRVVTPGTIIDNQALDDKNNNYLACVYFDAKSNSIGVSYVDISTGDLYTTDIKNQKKSLSTTLIDEIAKIKPRELIVNSALKGYENILEEISSKFDILINESPDWNFEHFLAEENIKRQFDLINLEGLDLADKKHATISTGALLEYLNETQKIALNHINDINVYSLENYMVLDINTRRNLELVETIRDKSKKGTLLHVLDNTSTSMGARLLKKWIQEPLVDKIKINTRQNIIECFIEDIFLMNDVKDILKGINDIDRLIAKISYNNCNGRELISLKQSISRLSDLKRILSKSRNEELIKFGESIDPLKDIYKLIDRSIVEEPPIAIKEGNIIKSNYSEELQDLREASVKGKEWLADLETKERMNSGIKNLKIKYNKVFGYFLEVSKANIGLVPDYFERKQTLTNAERYITDELKVMEEKILGSQDKMMDLEYDIFIRVREGIKLEIERIQKTSKLIAKIDSLNSLASVSYDNNYIRPSINTDGIIDIKNGRHPVVEKVLDAELFVPNDTFLDTADDRLSVITGPNMAGKSTYMRQVALITLMAQIGCFVPADSANISIADRIFTRIGASDDLSQGQSTFMVEMNEVANILNNATKDSLVILDEIGRGTSTYDGLSIAWAVTEYIADKVKLGSKTLFATHYHELTELEGKLDGVKNYKVAVKENDSGSITFLRKIVRGEADRSYGIEVAKLAGVRREVIDRACEILEDLEDNDLNNKYSVKETPLDIFAFENKADIFLNDTKSSEKSYKYDEIIDEMKALNIVDLTPLDTMNILHKLWNKIQTINKY